LPLRRRLRRTVDGLLQGLKQLSERRGVQVACAAGYPVGPCAIALRSSSAS
jgi:hypothetical protein